MLTHNREDGDLIGEAETAPVDANTNGNGEGVDTEMSHLDSLRGDLTNPPTPQQQVRNVPHNDCLPILV